jgi:uncharacterized protein
MAAKAASRTARRNFRTLILSCAALWCLALAPITAIGMSGSARAQGGTGASYITPFPDNDSYRLEVWGDVLAEGLLVGLIDQFADEPRVAVQKRHRAIASLMRSTFDDDIGEIVSEIARSTAHIVVIQIGLNDRVPLRLANGRRAAVGSEPWRAEYSRRIDRIMRAFKAQRIAAYWVGLPIMRRPDANDDAQVINELLRERANVTGLKMIDVYAATADAGGNYDAYGPDVSGTNRLLRQGDGITFTAAGNRKLAHFVERQLKRDLVQSRAQRSVPLAGSETEQRLIRPQREPQPSTARSSTSAESQPTAPTRPAAAATDGELKADNSRVTLTAGTESGRQETATVDLPRPAISGNLMALLGRRALSDRANQPGEVLVREIPGGLTLSRTISTAASPGAPQRRALPSQTPFFRVLVKGERLEPKAGRADDIVWPPTAASATPVAEPTAAPAPAAAPERRSRTSPPPPIPRPNPR